MSIKISYNNFNVVITKSDGSNISFPMPVGEFNNSDQQLIIRKLDCIKDAFSINNATKIKMMKDIFTNVSINSKVDLDHFKNGAIFDKNKDKIEPYSWLKSSSLGNSFDIKYVFHETGLSPEDYIRNLKFTSNTPSFEMVGSFQSEIGDPFNRKSEKISFRYPSNGTSLTFDQSFMNFFGFENTSYSSTLVEEIPGKSGVYNYKIGLDNETNNYSSKKISKESTGTDTLRYPGTPSLNVMITDCKEPYEVSINSSASGDEYFKGNTYKNAVSEALYNSNKGNNHNISEIKRYIIGKELGDVMQVLLMMIWQNDYLNSNLSLDEKNKSFCMTSNDSVVFLLCNMMDQPCFYTSSFSKEDHFKLTGEQKNAAIEGKFYNIYYFTPKVITSDERLKTRFEQKYNEIKANNLKIQNFVARVIAEGTIYIGNNIFNFHNDKRSVIENNFLFPIRDMISTIIKEREDFYQRKIQDNNILNEDFEFMNNNFILTPFISLVTTGKGFRKTNKYLFSPKIKDYTVTYPLLYNDRNGNKPYSFQNLFVRLFSGTLKGGAGEDESMNIITEGNKDNDALSKVNNSSENVVSPNIDLNEVNPNTEDDVFHLNKLSPIESNGSSIVEPETGENKMNISEEEEDKVEPLEKLSDISNKSKSPVVIENETPLKIEDNFFPEKQINIESAFEKEMNVDNKNEVLALEPEILPDNNDENWKELDELSRLIPFENDGLYKEEPIFSNSIFTDKVFLTFINQIVSFIDDENNNLSIEGFSIDSEKYIFNDESIFYFYYDMICYISYIQKRVYYDDELLGLMKNIKQYFYNEKGLKDIISQNYVIEKFSSNKNQQYDGDVNSYCNTQKSILDNKSPKAILYTQQVFDTFDEINSQPMDSYGSSEFDRINMNPNLSPLQEMDLDENQEPSLGVKRQRETESNEEEVKYKKGKATGGKTLKKKVHAKKHRKTRGGGSSTRKKRSIKKKASRRKKNTIKKGL